MREFTYLGDRVFVGDGCKIFLIARTRCDGLGNMVSYCMDIGFL